MDSDQISFSYYVHSYYLVLWGDYSLFDINHEYQLESLARIAKHIHSSYVYR